MMEGSPTPETHPSDVISDKKCREENNKAPASIEPQKFVEEHEEVSGGAPTGNDDTSQFVAAQNHLNESTHSNDSLVIKGDGVKDNMDAMLGIESVGNEPPHPSEEELLGKSLSDAIASSPTPPPLKEEEADKGQIAKTPQSATAIVATDPLQDQLHQRQPTGTHISEQMAEQLFAEEEAHLSNSNASPLTPIVESSRGSSPHSNIASPVNLQQPVQQLQQTSPPNQQNAVVFQTPSRITYATAPVAPTPPSSAHTGRRSITLRLLEEIAPPPMTSSSPLISSVNTPFRSLRRFRSLSLSSSALKNTMSGMSALDEKTTTSQNDGEQRVVDRGTISVSWYEGTTSSEMQEHVFNCVLRKLNSIPEMKNKVGAGGKIKLEDVRLLDENVTPHGGMKYCVYRLSDYLFIFMSSVGCLTSSSPSSSLQKLSSVPSYPMDRIFC